jgi:hypothetical protein
MEHSINNTYIQRFGDHIRRVSKMTTQTEALKYDTKKPRCDLLPGDAILSVADVLTYGANKYTARNWESGMDWGRLSGAAQRHLLAWQNGNDTDDESGLPHLAHAICCLLFLLAYSIRGKGRDDRKKVEASNNYAEFTKKKFQAAYKPEPSCRVCDQYPCECIGPNVGYREIV